MPTLSTIPELSEDTELYAKEVSVASVQIAPPSALIAMFPSLLTAIIRAPVESDAISVQSQAKEYTSAQSAP